MKTLLDIRPGLRTVGEGQPDAEGSCVLYWMQRAQRGRDNPALNLAIDVANAMGKPVVAAFALTPDYPGAQKRHYKFLVEGLPEVRDALAARNVAFLVRIGDPAEIIARLANELRPVLVVGDENPLRIGRVWRAQVAEALTVPLVLVDADVVVPSILFPKEEFAARTIRPKILRVRDEYLRPIPNPRARSACAFLRHSWCRA